MRKIKLQDLTPGMKTAEDIYSYNNNLIVPKGATLTDELITKLELYSIYNVKSEGCRDSSIMNASHYVEDSPVVDSHSVRVRNSAEFKIFKHNFENEIIEFEDTLNGVVTGNIELDVTELLDRALNIMHSTEQTVNIFDMLQNMRFYDDSTFAHSLNVALICNVFAGWLNLTDEETETVTICGMLHDIGKLLIPEEIIKKPGPLTEEEFAIVKTHPVQGYELLKKLDIDPLICNAALLHHEKCDGSGYPFGLMGPKIDKFAKMIAIADVYDAMTSARIYRGPLCPFTVIDIFESEGLQKYDAEYIMIFLERVICTYVQNSVRLNNGQTGNIIYINSNRLSKPTVQVGNEFIDLSKRDDLYIEAII